MRSFSLLFATCILTLVVGQGDSDGDTNEDLKTIFFNTLCSHDKDLKTWLETEDAKSNPQRNKEDIRTEPHPGYKTPLQRCDEEEEELSSTEPDPDSNTISHSNDLFLEKPKSNNPENSNVTSEELFGPASIPVPSEQPSETSQPANVPFSSQQPAEPYEPKNVSVSSDKSTERYEPTNIPVPSEQPTKPPEPAKTLVPSQQPAEPSEPANIPIRSGKPAESSEPAKIPLPSEQPAAPSEPANIPITSEKPAEPSEPAKTTVTSQQPAEPSEPTNIPITSQQPADLCSNSTGDCEVSSKQSTPLANPSLVRETSTSNKTVEKQEEIVFINKKDTVTNISEEKEVVKTGTEHDKNEIPLIIQNSTVETRKEPILLPVSTENPNSSEKLNDPGLSANSKTPDDTPPSASPGTPGDTVLSASSGIRDDIIPLAKTETPDESDPSTTSGTPSHIVTSERSGTHDITGPPSNSGTPDDRAPPTTSENPSVTVPSVNSKTPDEVPSPNSGTPNETVQSTSPENSGVTVGSETHKSVPSSIYGTPNDSIPSPATISDSNKPIKDEEEGDPDVKDEPRFEALGPPKEKLEITRFYSSFLERLIHDTMMNEHGIRKKDSPMVLFLTAGES